jgi:SAM-dependent methyltransferase
MRVHQPSSGTPEEDPRSQAAQWRYEATRRLNWLLHVTRPAPPTSLLEAGSGGGFFLHAATQAGIQARGVELSPVCVHFARTRLGVQVRHGVFEAGAPPDPVGAVCAFGVLDLCDDPEEFLAAVRRALGPQGWLALEVGNAESAALRGTDPLAGELDVRHGSYSPRSLTRLLEASRFVVQHCDTVFNRSFVRPRRRLGVAGCRAFLTDWARTGTPRLHHTWLGDRIRVLARIDAVRHHPTPLAERAVRS